jgi:hypothetical protein
VSEFGRSAGALAFAGASSGSVAIRVCFIRIHDFFDGGGRSAPFAINVGDGAEAVKGAPRLSR